MYLPRFRALKSGKTSVLIMFITMLKTVDKFSINFL